MDNETIKFLQSMVDYQNEFYHQRNSNKNYILGLSNKISDLLPSYNAVINLIYLNDKNLIDNDDRNYVIQIKNRLNDKRNLYFQIFTTLLSVKIGHSLYYKYSLGIGYTLYASLSCFLIPSYFILKYIVINNKKNIYLNQKYISNIQTFLATGNILDINKDFELRYMDGDYKSTKDLKLLISQTITENNKNI